MKSAKGVLLMLTTSLMSSGFGLPPMIKWAGGKERELKYIIENAPSQYERFYDPFVGGGSVFMAMPAQEYFINDKSEELIDLYKAVKNADADMLTALSDITKAWDGTLAFISKEMDVPQHIYLRFREDAIDETKMREELADFIDKHSDVLIRILGETAVLPERYLSELNRCVVKKYLRIKEIEQEKHLMIDKDLKDNIRTAFMGSLYMYYRYLYNNEELELSKGCRIALFVYIRNYAYSGMFRYNAGGDFNVPYGGIAYNSKSLASKIRYYESPDVVGHLRNATIESMDFYDFLQKYPPRENDFVFLDPPYDSEFSTYANNDFNRDDQERLANYLIKECRGKWLMIIKSTPFILSLYDGHGLTIKAFDKKYQVSFMNRNNKDVEHLIIMNY